jgi:hypothetical protein
MVRPANEAALLACSVDFNHQLTLQRRLDSIVHSTHHILYIFITRLSRVFHVAVAKLAKKGLTPSQIGVILRDSHGIAQVKAVTGQKILRLLKRNGKDLLWRDPHGTRGHLRFCWLPRTP